MKLILLAASILACSTTVMASKARMASLQNADHIVDTQSYFGNPSDLRQLGQYITYEFGAAGTAAEGGFSRKLANGDNLSIYLGHKNTIVNFTNGDARTAAGYIGQNNPIEVMYATGTMGFGGSVSTLDDKKNGVKETTVIGKFGVTNPTNSFFVHLHLISAAEKTTGVNTDKFTSAPQVVVGGKFDVENLHYFGNLHIGQAKNEIASPASSTKIDDQNMTIGLLDRSMKTADNDIYYGAQIDYASRNVGGSKITGTQMPVFLGMEYTLNSWATFRGSVVQNMLLGSKKDETATNKDAAGISNNTTVAAGLGLKYNSLILDGSLTAATSGQVNGNAFLANAAVIYNF